MSGVKSRCDLIFEGSEPICDLEQQSRNRSRKQSFDSLIRSNNWATIIRHVISENNFNPAWNHIIEMSAESNSELMTNGDETILDE
jgi:hypothetical protein